MDFFKRMFAAVLAVFKLPDVADSAAVRKLVQTVLGFIASAAEWTPTEIDDEAVALVLRLVADDETWAAIHIFLLDRLTDQPVVPVPNGEAGELAAMLVGLYADD